MSAVQDMVNEGQSQISSIESQVLDLERQIAEAESQLETTQQGREGRAQRLQQAQLLVTQVQAKHTEASGVAKIAHGKPRQKTATRELAEAKMSATCASC